MNQIPNSPQTPRGVDPCQLSEPTCPSNLTTPQGKKLFLKLLQTLKTPGSSSPKFHTLGMKTPDRFDSENSLQLQAFLQSCKLLFSNEPSVFSDDHKKVLYAASYLSVRNAEFELNSLSMKDNGKASTYISQFRTLQSRVDWNDAAFAFHFQKGLPSRITNQLALTGQRLKTLQQLIDRTIELDNCYHDKVWSSKKADSTPSTLKNKDPLKHKSSKKFPSKPSTPFASSLASRPKRSTEIALVLSKEGQLNWDEHARREREGLCLYCGGKHELDSCVKRIAREAAKLAKK
ncbi:uncharacterized protein VP01_5836g1 [Puccinia sorghi]|uniref:Retrotransposon gag domain-containing protein n=1 Tax=Puccinia sorghi TaxID=27349 RepID=A0A0L6UI16_9BASI|nr:uncharacterized protein VP01_5836g1 [Puccinia sorghi]